MCKKYKIDYEDQRVTFAPLKNKVKIKLKTERGKK